MGSTVSTTPLKVTPVNAAEAYLANFADKAISPAWQFTLASGTHAEGVREFPDRGWRISWDDVAAGTAAFHWRWQGALDLTLYDHLVLNAGIPIGTQLRLQARIDGTWQTLAQAPGEGTHCEYGGAFSGNTLEELHVECLSDTGSRGAFETFWLLTWHGQRLEQHHQVLLRNHPDPDWPGFLAPASDWEAREPLLGLHFDTEQVPAIQARMQREPYARLAEHFREELREFLRQEPEALGGEFLVLADRHHNYSARDRNCGPVTPWRALHLCSFFGLLEGNPDIIRHAARLALTIAHSAHWTDSVISEGYPGGTTHAVGFNQQITAGLMASALDWIGFALTPAARELIRQRLYFLGVAPLDWDMATYEYVHTMNQGLLLSAGRIQALLALTASYPRFQPLLDQAHRELDNISRVVLSGQQRESIGYFFVSLNALFQAYAPLAGRLQMPLAKLLPVDLSGITERCMLFASSVHPAAWLRVGDTNISTLMGTAPFCHLATLTGDARWGELIRQYLEHLPWHLERNHKHPTYIRTGLDVVPFIHGPDELPSVSGVVPDFACDRDAGHLTCLRESPVGPVRLHLSGKPANEGHNHKDRGSILLEAFGEEVLVDRGITPYNDPRSHEYKESANHNLVTPVDEEGNCCDQPLFVADAIPPQATLSGAHLTASMDLTPAWPKAANRVTRRIDSSDALHYTLTDELRFDTPRAVVFHLHSYGAVKVDGATACFTADGWALNVTWDWDGEVTHAGLGLPDSHQRPVYHLAIRSAPALRHRLVTHLTCKQIKSCNILGKQLQQGGVI